MLTKDKIQVVEEAPRNWNAQPPSLNDINVLVPKVREEPAFCLVIFFVSIFFSRFYLF